MIQPFLRFGSELKKEAGLHALFEMRLLRQAVDSFIREGKKGPKHGRCRTLEWQRKAGSYLFFQACSDIRFPRKIKLVSRVMGNLPARFGEH